MFVSQVAHLADGRARGASFFDVSQRFSTGASRLLV